MEPTGCPETTLRHIQEIISHDSTMSHKINTLRTGEADLRF